MAVDRDAAKKSRRTMALGNASALTAANTAAAAGNAAAAGDAATRTAAAAGTAAEPEMVQPESLPQGFVVVVKDLSGLATKDSPIFMASSHNGWDPGDKRTRFEPRSDLRWQLVWEKPKIDANVKFKLTRGNWDTTQVKENLEDVPDQDLPMVDISNLPAGEKPIIELVVLKWQDQRPSAAARPDLNPYFKIEGRPNIRRLQVAGGGVPVVRDLIISVPPGYDDPANAARTYPVLYMQDGQNLFLDMPGTKGSWNADTAVADLIAKGETEPFIIVGIPHLGKARATEYLPVPMIEGVEPRGAEYTSWMLSEVMPRVERAFRVKSGPENTAIGGASLGAVIALHIASERPDVFGKVLLESMPLIGSASGLMKHFEGRKSFPPVIYFAIGGQELGNDAKDAQQNKRYADSAAQFRMLANTKALDSGQKNVQIIVDDAGTHDEATWARRFPSAVRMLFVKPAGGSK